MGVPTKFNTEIADEICFQIIDGKSLRKICEMDGMPDLRNLMRWVERHEDFRQQYVHARATQAEIKFDDLKDLARTATPEDVQCVKLQIDVAKWELSKTLPKKYGDKIDIDVTGDLKVTVMEIVTREEADADDDGFIST